MKTRATTSTAQRSVCPQCARTLLPTALTAMAIALSVLTARDTAAVPVRLTFAECAVVSVLRAQKTIARAVVLIALANAQVGVPLTAAECAVATMPRARWSTSVSTASLTVSDIATAHSRLTTPKRACALCSTQRRPTSARCSTTDLSKDLHQPRHTRKYLRWALGIKLTMEVPSTLVPARLPTGATLLLPTARTLRCCWALWASTKRCTPPTGTITCCRSTLLAGPTMAWVPSTSTSTAPVFLNPLCQMSLSSRSSASCSKRSQTLSTLSLSTTRRTARQRCTSTMLKCR
mmetsp:Transcript_25684/g.37842  ORF Transcript_25684/g.37842 Transcript_25684/m.37842 type:complete len:291 (+) Transcript_25684:5451-6323(+)